MTNDQELIRKVAEAMHATQARQIGEGLIVRFGVEFERLTFQERVLISEQAEAVLKVFYEHARSQPREGHGVRCEDCGGAMTPTAWSPPPDPQLPAPVFRIFEHWTCQSYGKSV